MYDWTNWIVFGALILLTSVRAIYHVGWKRGWECGFQSARHLVKADQRRQPTVRTILAFPYAFSWHHGWDRGFRAGVRREPKGRL